MEEIKKTEITGTEQYVPLILDFMKEAGKIACEYRKEMKQNLKCQIKKDKTLVTEADRKISDLFKTKIQHLLDNGHCLIDEEKVKSFDKILEKFKNAEYTWVIDPIDGTEPYATNSPEWGIAVGLYEKGRPYLGFIYAPAFHTIIYCNENTTYTINTYEEEWKSEKLVTFTKKKSTKEKSKIRPKIFGHNHSNRGTVDFDNSNMNVYDHHTACIYAIKTFLGQSQGFVICSRSSIWDIAPAIPIAQRMGLKMYNVYTKEIIENLDLEKMVKKDWHLKLPVLFCHPNHAEFLLNQLTLKKEKHPEIFEKEEKTWREKHIVNEEERGQYHPCLMS